MIKILSALLTLQAYGSSDFKSVFEKYLPLSPQYKGSIDQVYYGKSPWEKETNLEARILQSKKLSIYDLQATHTSNVTVSLRAERDTLAIPTAKTLIIIPGIFGEFILTPAFKEIFEVESLAKSEFQKILGTINCERRWDDKTCDFNLQLSKIKHVKENYVQRIDDILRVNPEARSENSLSEYFHIGSIDNAQGVHLRVILLKTPMMSLESLSSISEVSGIFSRRLEKLFKLYSDTGIDLGKVALVGYSRGTDVGLEMLRLFPNKNWSQKTEAFVSLGGVVYGSDMADQLDKANSVSQIQFSALQELEKNLVTRTSSRFGTCTTHCQNRKTWFQFINRIEPTLRGSIDDLTKGTTFDPVGLNLAVSVAQKFGLWNSQQSIIDNLTDLFSDEYALNIYRFKLVIRSVSAAAPELTTASRTKWWNQGGYPGAHIKYYSLAATMVDPESQRDLALSQEANQPFSGPDYYNLLKGYRGFFEASEHTLNDSQVAVAKAQFLPANNIHVEELGILGAHHWALALAFVQNNPNGEYNHFPRKALAMALGDYCLK